MNMVSSIFDNLCSEFTIANYEKIITHKLPSINKIERDFNMNVSRLFEKDENYTTITRGWVDRRDIKKMGRNVIDHIVIKKSGKSDVIGNILDIPIIHQI